MRAGRPSMRAGRPLRSGSFAAACAVGVLDGLLASSSGRAIAVLLSAAALAPLAAALSSGDARARLAGFVLLAGATAVAFSGPLLLSHVIGAAAAGLLVLASAELARWAGVVEVAGPAPASEPSSSPPAATTDRASPGAIEVRGPTVLRGISIVGLGGLAGAALGWLLVEARQVLAGFGLAALALGAIAVIALVVLLGSLARCEGSPAPKS